MAELDRVVPFRGSPGIRPGHGRVERDRQRGLRLLPPEGGARLRDPVRIRRARLEDRPALGDLIARSARGLSGEYEDRQVESALATGVFGVDTELVEDGTYLVAEAGDRLVGCGGWSRRRTLFGGDAFTDRASERLDPAREPAKIRAFFVDPAWARRGIGRALLERCEAPAMPSTRRSSTRWRTA